MKTIREGSRLVSAIIRNSYPKASAAYRLSAFVLPFSDRGIHLLIHMLSDQIVQLSAPEKAALELLLSRGSMPYSFFRDNGLEELVKNCFAVETDLDDTEQYLQAFSLLKAMQKEKPGISIYTILPTTACNARCDYCFEEGMRVSSMSGRTETRLADYICETKREGKIRLHWFGGEPLLSRNTITRICRTLTARGVDYISSTTTNGSLITPELAREMADVWKLDMAQVSLDGDRESYHARKRYADTERFNYDTVMRGIHLLADAGAHVSLRVNCDRRNLSGLPGFLEEMEREFGADKKVSLYLYMLYQENTAPDAMELLEKINALTGLVNRNHDREAEDRDGKDPLKKKFCKAADMDHEVVIDPEGNLYACDQCLPGTSWGNIFDGVTDPALFKRLKAPTIIAEQCRDCLFLPRCTAFAKARCPVCMNEPHCREGRRMELEQGLRRITESMGS